MSSLLRLFALRRSAACPSSGSWAVEVPDDSRTHPQPDPAATRIPNSPFRSPPGGVSCSRLALVLFDRQLPWSRFFARPLLRSTSGSAWMLVGRGALMTNADIIELAKALAGPVVVGGVFGI